MSEFRKWFKKWDDSMGSHHPGAHHSPKFNLFGSLFGFKSPIGRILRRLRMGFYNYEDKEDEYVLQIEVPGIEKDKISAKASADTLTVEIDGEPHFYPLPPNVVAEKVYATLKLGILTIHLPKKEPDRTVDIE
ncbi:MAG: Hsp20/alpha crystallin family protein [Candidatus Helarchaeota archaeon]|nr:Hsp20/alpha crystallin family protein [Candidatus Helarchaeota archaeon]